MRFVHRINIADFFGMQWGEFYQCLESTKQDEFHSDERICFYLYDTADYKLLRNLFVDFYKQIRALDIPNFFVYIEVASADSKRAVMEAYDTVGADHAPTVDVVPAKLTNTHISTSVASYNLPETVCPMPWNSLDIDALGKISPCCFYNTTTTKFDPTKDSLESAYNSDYMRQLRQDFKAGKKPAGCIRCWREEESGTESKRQMYTKRFGRDSGAINWDQDDIQNLRMVSISFGNVCNFQCRICSSKSSSRIAAEENDTRALELGKWIRNADNIWDEVICNPQIRYFDFAGGEPLLDKEHLRALKFMIEKGIAGEVSLHYNTNGSVVNDELLDIWKNFKQVDIAVSIDDLGERFNYQRPGVGKRWNWELVNANVRYIEQHKSNNIQLSMHTAISTLNAYYLPELADWASTVEFDSIHVSVLYNPTYLCIRNMPKDAAATIRKRLEQHAFNQTFQPFVDTVIAELNKTKATYNAKFVEYINRLDERRNEQYNDAHSEISSKLGLANS